MRQVHHALQRMLPRADVRVPFAERIADRFDCARVEVRRAFPQLLALIQASAILHFRQRHVDDSGSLIASITDYQIARRRIAKPFAQSLGGGLSDAAMKGWPEGEFTSRDAAKRAPAQRSSVYAWLGELLTTRRRRLPPMERSWRTR